jgi:hypothetical protein
MLLKKSAFLIVLINIAKFKNFISYCFNCYKINPYTLS